MERVIMAKKRAKKAAQRPQAEAEQAVNDESPEDEVVKPKPLKRVMRGEREKTHDLYRLEPEIFKNNISYKFFEPKIQEELHTHYYHTIDRLGRPSNVSSKNVGHYHYMKIVHDKETGEMKVVCGPPRRKVVKKVRGKDRMVEERIFYGGKTWNEATEENENGKIAGVIDEHTHDIEYHYSEVLKY